MLKLNAGISRKVGEPDYGSRGATVNLELEIESNLVSEPNALMDRIRRLFALARQAVNEELNITKSRSPHAASRTNGRNGSTRSHGAASAPRPATAAQVRAIQTIADRFQLDADVAARQRFGVDVADLSITAASAFIDELKSQNGSTR